MQRKPPTNTDAPQWEALVVGYGQWIAYARQGDGFMYEEMNQEMHSVMYATRNFLERRALKVAKIAEDKTRMDSKVRVCPRCALGHANDKTKTKNVCWDSDVPSK